MTKDGHQQERGTPRFTSGVHAALHAAGGTHPCRAGDLSRSGVLLEGEIPGTVSGAVEVTLSDPGGTFEIRLAANVVRNEPLAGGDEQRIGLSFEIADPATADRLEVLVKRVIESTHLVPLDDLSQDADAATVREAVGRIPVAKRIALAARAQRRERVFLLQDTDVQVLQALVRNPHLTRAEVLELTGIRNLLAGTLEQIARDPRWSKDDDIRLAVAVHHRVPLPLAERLIGGLGTVALRKALASPALRDELRRKIVYRLSHRS